LPKIILKQRFMSTMKIYGVRESCSEVAQTKLGHERLR